MRWVWIISHSNHWHLQWQDLSACVIVHCSNSLSLKFSACIMFLKIYHRNIKDLMRCFVQPLELKSTEPHQCSILDAHWNSTLNCHWEERRRASQFWNLVSCKVGHETHTDCFIKIHSHTWVTDIFICNENCTVRISKALAWGRKCSDLAKPGSTLIGWYTSC